MPDAVVLPRSLPEALTSLDEDPPACLLAGGTDLMVELNAGQRRPRRVVALRAVPELRGWARNGDVVRLGAGLTWTEMLDPAFVAVAPALAQAARTVGSPQIRNAGTLGGNLGTASPAGDALPVLAALDAVVEVASRSGSRELGLDELLLGPKHTSLAPGELIVAVRVPAAVGRQEYLKVGVRNAMVIAVASVALVLDPVARSVAVGLGSVGPTPLRAPEAETWIAERLRWQRDRDEWAPDGPPSQGPIAAVEPADLEGFALRVAAAAQPIDDHRSSAVYRRHAVGVMARRALRRACANGEAMAA